MNNFCSPAHLYTTDQAPVCFYSANNENGTSQAYLPSSNNITLQNNQPASILVPPNVTVELYTNNTCTGPAAATLTGSLQAANLYYTDNASIQCVKINTTSDWSTFVANCKNQAATQCRNLSSRARPAVTPAPTGASWWSWLIYALGFVVLLIIVAACIALVVWTLHKKPKQEAKLDIDAYLAQKELVGY